jgi:hypothetical protein
MIRKNLCLLALASSMALAIGGANAQESSALIDALVRKGVLTDQEAEEIRADLSKEFATSPAGKINIGSWVQELRLGGDLRLRYQYDDQERQVASSNHVDQRSRWRFRLRLNADFKLANNFYGGVQLSTGQAADSGNQTFENGFDDYNIFISKAFLGWRPIDGIDIIAGKQDNPLYTTDLVWDPDITPTGLVEKVELHKLFGWGSGGETVGYSKEGKAPPPPPEEPPSPLKFELSFIAGQYIFDDNLEYGEFDDTRTLDNDAANDAYYFVEQLKFGVKGKNWSFTIAPGFLATNAAAVLGLTGERQFNDQLGDEIADNNFFVLGATRDLYILTVPGDFTIRAGDLPITLYWDFAYNVAGDDRFDLYEIDPVTGDLDPIVDANGNRVSPSITDNLAWLVGIRIGQNKKPGDWSVFGDFRQVGISSIDPNINDSDWALSNLNMQGFKFGAAYSFTDFLTAAITGFVTWNLTEDLVGGQVTGNNAIGRANTVKTLQVDLSYRF